MESLTQFFSVALNDPDIFDNFIFEVGVYPALVEKVLGGAVIIFDDVVDDVLDLLGGGVLSGDVHVVQVVGEFTLVHA